MKLSIFIIFIFGIFPIKLLSQTIDSSQAIIQSFQDEQLRIKQTGSAFNLQFWGLVTHHYHFSIHIFHAEENTPLMESIYFCEIPKIEGTAPNCRFQEVAVMGEIPVLANQPTTNAHASCINQISIQFEHEFPFGSIYRIDSGVDNGTIHIQFSFLGIDEIFNQKRYECIPEVDL
jgi:hypothetical protein